MFTVWHPPKLFCLVYVDNDLARECGSLLAKGYDDDEQFWICTDDPTPILAMGDHLSYQFCLQVPAPPWERSLTP